METDNGVISLDRDALVALDIRVADEFFAAMERLIHPSAALGRRRLEYAKSTFAEGRADEGVMPWVQYLTIPAGATGHRSCDVSARRVAVGRRGEPAQYSYEFELNWPGCGSLPADESAKVLACFLAVARAAEELQRKFSFQVVLAPTP